MANLQGMADFVLKIKIKGGDDEDTQIRRVRLPRICSGPSGTVSYEELVGLAISFVIPEKPAHVSDFDVKLTYKDVDDDVVVIGSSEELLDAIDQFRDQRVLRIAAEIKRSSRAKPLSEQQLISVEGNPSRASGTSNDGDGSGSTGATNSDTPVPAVASVSATTARSGSQGSPVLQNVVESVVNIILNAAVAINGNQSSPPQAPAVPQPAIYYTPEGVPEPSTEAAPNSAESISSSNAVSPASSPACRRSSSSSDRRPGAGKFRSTPVVAPTNNQNNQSSDKPKKPLGGFMLFSKEHRRKIMEENPGITLGQVGRKLDEMWRALSDEEKEKYRSPPTQELPTPAETAPVCQAPPEEKPFIHGRHTCDNCLTTPIVGKRYHALNMSDYDLCEKCFSNYGGTGEIQFEAVELERDRQLQNRWNRRFHRMNNGEDLRRGFGPRAHHNRWNLPPSQQTKVPPSRRQVAAKHQPPAPTSWKSAVEQRTSEAYAMEMAMQLSLRDIQEKTKRDAIKESLMGTPGYSTPVEPSAEQSNKQEPAVAPGDAGSVANQSGASKTEEEKPAVAPEPSAPMEEEVLVQSKPMESVQVETVRADDDDEEEEQEEAGNEESSTSSKPFVVRMPSVDGSFSSDVSCTKKRSDSNEEPRSSRDTSFSSDAVGNGEIADMLGETLDRCAEAINAMVSELDRTSFDGASTASSYVGVNNCETSEGNENDEGNKDDDGTTTILEPAEKNTADDVSAERTEEDWQVVNEDHQINSDEDLARAAQMIGSALFNSDMRSSGEVVSNLTGSGGEFDGMSHDSSALTSLPSVSSHQISSAQRKRWSSQLVQLRTLGIDDEARCVEILERLTAANIGCGSNDEVSVTDVVNALWK